MSRGRAPKCGTKKMDLTSGPIPVRGTSRVEIVMKEDSEVTGKVVRDQGRVHESFRIHGVHSQIYINTLIK